MSAVEDLVPVPMRHQSIVWYQFKLQMVLEIEFMAVCDTVEDKVFDDLECPVLMLVGVNVRDHVILDSKPPA